MILFENLSIAKLEDSLTRQKEWDVFISCGSFEKRCLMSSTIFLNRGVRVGDSIVFDYRESDPQEKKEENMLRMKSNLRKVSQSVNVFDQSSVSFPSLGIKRFLAFLKKGRISLSDKKMVVDITVFTKPYFFLLFKVLKEKFNLCRFHVIYTEPEKYKLRSLDTGKVILTEGLDRIESIPGFVGSSVNPKDSLIVILGFEGKRSIEVFHTVEPEVTYAINGFPSYQPGWHKTSLEANIRFLNESKASNRLFFAPAIDPFETKRVISRIVDEIKENSPNTNIIIAPLGTKMQAFGVLLYALQNRDIKVIYPFPSTYSPDYSFRHGPTRIFRANLERP